MSIASVIARFRRIAALFAFAFLCSAALGGRDAAGEENSAAPPVVVLELFTSQGCYSCPPAEKLLASRYLAREGVLALELHVDYWDELIYGFAGKWKDPWSNPAYTARQRDYNLSLRSTGGVYTPQAVIHGAYYASGANAGAIDRAIAEVKKIPATRAYQVRFARGGDTWLAEVRPAGDLSSSENGKKISDLEVRAVVFAKRAETEVTAGENKGKKLANHNIVTALAPALPAPDAAAVFESGENAAGDVFRLPPIDDAREGCALIIQRPQSGVIVAAARCPAA